MAVPFGMVAPEKEETMILGSKYKVYVLQEYLHWHLVLHEEQRAYPGRTYAWYKDRHQGEGEGLAPWMAPKESTYELLHVVTHDVLRALKSLGYNTHDYGSTFLLNMCYLANIPAHNHHLHWHFIPRSKHSFTIEGLGYRVDDKNWGNNYTPAPVSLPTHDPAMPLRIHAQMKKALHA